MDNKQTYIEKLWRDIDSKDQTIADLRAKLAEKDAEIASLNTKLIDASNQPGVNNINFDALWKIKGDLEVKLAEKEREIDLLTKMVEGVSGQCTILNNNLSLYRRAVGPVLMDNLETLHYVLKYVERAGLSAENDVLASIEKTEACIRILGEDSQK